LTKEDATDFVGVHFPAEGRLLKQPTDHLALLQRATTFVHGRKYKAEVYAQCSMKWVVFLYYVVNNKYPPISQQGSVDIEHCVQAITSIPAHRERLVLDIGRLFHGHPSLVSAMIQDHSLAFRLYGTSGLNAPVGIQKLMAAGVAYMYFWMLRNSSARHKTVNIDEYLPSALLAYILAARGILAPVDGQPAFESDCIPIHHQATVYTSAATLIRTQEPCILSLPPSTIRRGITDDEYRTHYQAPLGMDAGASTRLMNVALAEFHKSSYVERGLSTSTCLFPQEKLGAIKDVTVGTPHSYLVGAGQRLVLMLKGIEQAPVHDSSQLSSSSKITLLKTNPSVPSTPPSVFRSSPVNKGSDLKQSFLIRNNGSILLSKTPPTVDAVSLPELKRRVLDLRAKKAKADKQQQAAQRDGSVGGAGQLNAVVSRYKFDTHIVNMYDSYKDVGSMYSTDWTVITDGFEGNQRYLEEIRFFDKATRPVNKGDAIIMLYDVNRITTSLFNCSHLLYTVYSVVGHATYAYFTESLWSVGEAQVDGFFPSKIVVQIPGPYILFVESGQNSTLPSEKSRPSASSVHWGAPNTQYGNIDDEDTSSNEADGHTADVGSEDSDAKRIAKTTSIQMGRMTFKVVGKTALRDDLQKGIAICNIMEEGRMDILLTPLGVYGHTVTAANIIAGIFRHGMDDSDFMAENINAPRRNNKALVQTQAWTPYKNLFSNMAFQQYQLAANMTEDSIRSIHFVQLKLAVERNYLLQSWHDWILHLEGYKQFVQELYGPSYSSFFQTVLLDIQGNHLGEANNVVYLDALSNKMRAQLYHFASRDLPFKAPGEHVLRYPQKMSKDEWLEVMLAQWTDLKAHLTIAHEMAFNYAQASFKVHEPKPMGHKPRQGQNEVRLKPVVLPQPKGAADDGKVKQKRKREAKKRPAVHFDEATSINVCVGDLLNHYGATEQISCKVPCRYTHYDALPPKIAKSSILKRCMLVADLVKLSAETKAFLKAGIVKDKKFQ